MNTLESFEYNRNTITPQCLNELNIIELQDFIQFRDMNRYTTEKELWEKSISDFFEMLIIKYPEKTFCIQTDYDYMFGNISWQKTHLYYADAEDAILKDWAAREEQPHHTLDKSYISVYTFAELKNAEEDKKQDIIGDLQSLLKGKLK